MDANEMESAAADGMCKQKLTPIFVTVIAVCLLGNVVSFFVLSDGHGINPGNDGIVRVGWPFVFFERGGFGYRCVIHLNAVSLDCACWLAISTLVTVLWAFLKSAETRKKFRAGKSGKCFTATGIILAVAALAACNRTNVVEDAQAALDPLVLAFGVPFPTNGIPVRAASWDYRAPLDGNSKNTETIARMQISQSAFRSWHGSATNKMEEYPGFRVPSEPRLTRKFPWWDPHIWPSPQVVYFHKEIDKGPASIAKLEVYCVEQGSNVLFYVYACD